MALKKDYYCADKQLLKLLDVCPSIVKRLDKRLFSELYDAYEDLAEEFGIMLRTTIVYIGDTAKIHHFAYYYRIDDGMVIESDSEGYKTFAEAQLELVHQTMYELRNRIDRESLTQ